MCTSSRIESVHVSASWLLQFYKCTHIFKYTLSPFSLFPCPLWFVSPTLLFLFSLRLGISGKCQYYSMTVVYMNESCHRYEQDIIEVRSLEIDGHTVSLSTLILSMSCSLPTAQFRCKFIRDTHTCIYTGTYMRCACVYVHIQIHMHVYLAWFIQKYIHVFVCVYIYVCMHTHILLHIYAHIYHTRVCICTTYDSTVGPKMTRL